MLQISAIVYGAPQADQVVSRLRQVLRPSLVTKIVSVLFNKHRGERHV